MSFWHETLEVLNPYKDIKTTGEDKKVKKKNLEQFVENRKNITIVKKNIYLNGNLVKKKVKRLSRY